MQLRPIQLASPAKKPSRRALFGALTGLGAGLVLGAGSISVLGRPRDQLLAEPSWRRRAAVLAAGDPVELVRQHDFIVVAFHLSLSEGRPLNDVLIRLAEATTDLSVSVEPRLRARAHAVLTQTASHPDVPASVRVLLERGLR